VVETLDHDSQYLKDGISDDLVLRHILVLEQLVTVVGDQTASHIMLHHVNSVQFCICENTADLEIFLMKIQLQKPDTLILTSVTFSINKIKDDH